jgi:hypothetical protein
MIAIAPKGDTIPRSDFNFHIAASLAVDVPRPRKQHPISVGEINLAVVIIDVLPLGAREPVKCPHAVHRSKVSIPADANPIEF